MNPTLHLYEHVPFGLLGNVGAHGDPGELAGGGDRRDVGPRLVLAVLQHQRGAVDAQPPLQPVHETLGLTEATRHDA